MAEGGLLRVGKSSLGVEHALGGGDEYLVLGRFPCLEEQVPRPGLSSFGLGVHALHGVQEESAGGVEGDGHDQRGEAALVCGTHHDRAIHGGDLQQNVGPDAGLQRGSQDGRVELANSAPPIRASVTLAAAVRERRAMAMAAMAFCVWSRILSRCRSSTFRPSRSGPSSTDPPGEGADAE
ncbi:hypothetical protein [Streptomyces goshikiensis]|uniref:hypothetical protein n=1 Tax=Streptomyces goshikiensis TaxID=1942 RepID=UPI0036C77DCB